MLAFCLGEGTFVGCINFKEYFKIDHFFEITKECEDRYMMAGFGTSCGNDRIIDYYLNNKDVLEKFILYFKHQANNLIKLSKKQENRLVLPEYCGKEFKLKEIGKKIDCSTFNSIPLVFSKREIDCIRYLLLGNSMCEIGDKLFISPRTVETYIKNIKNKLGCNKKSELITKLLKNGFAQNILFESMG